MTDSVYVNSLEVITSIFFLVWFFYGPWSQFVIDLARQNLFEIRDEVFILAANGEIEFSTELYQGLRNHFNRMIRHCHNLTLLSVFVAYAFSKKREQKVDRVDILSLIRSLGDTGASRALERKYFRAFFIIGITTIFRSGLLSILTMLFLPLLIILVLMKGSSKQDTILQNTYEAMEYDLARESGFC